MLKRKFAIALASAGITQSDWARMHQLSQPGLSQLLSGKMKSKRHLKSVNSFIAAEFKKLQLSVGNTSAGSIAA
ncbi:MAG: hypothetical protein WC898_02285 [Candidatus Paceibacterota bacterium]|jgi:predicted transcriptional regulator